MLQQELTTSITEKAKSLGFFQAGITKAEPLDATHLDDWLARGYHGDMAYMKDRRDIYIYPSILISEAKPVIVCVLNYYASFELNLVGEFLKWNKL